LGRQICHRYADENRVLHVLTLDPTLEQKIIESRVETSSGVLSALDPAVQNAWIKSLARSVTVVQEQGWFPIIVCSESARYLVKCSTDRDLPELVVLSVPEIVADITLESVGVIRLDH
jgi:flagellar biosynthesis protein FlhA